ncbi:hypothetical protein [Acidocella aminolytica]|uniref:hypothetical protein n=1 Tax=Acidocella aminolytica TaxID=33998 RepID=UPI001114D0A5|nr:hypothetical protein [Acidocella aminolytica]
MLLNESLPLIHKLCHCRKSAAPQHHSAKASRRNLHAVKTAGCEINRFLQPHHVTLNYMKNLRDAVGQRYAYANLVGINQGRVLLFGTKQRSVFGWFLLGAKLAFVAILWAFLLGVIYVSW